MLLKGLLLATVACSPSALAAFGVNKSGDNIVVDAGATNALVFTVNAKSCDITSIKYRGEELQSSSKGSHISSGLGSATVKYETISS
jgi:rhamnogalacturonan endolyase